jgi:GntR family transcriptional regulator/MocR family aminotransferase
VQLSIIIEGRHALSAQIYREIRGAILDERIQVGERLPATRELAQQLNVSRNTVIAAYDRLIGEGYLRASLGSGTFVEPDLSGRRSPRHPATSCPPPQISAFGRRLSLPRLIVPKHDLPYDFRPGVPELGFFPTADWRRIARRHWKRLSASVAYYGDPAGDPALRLAIARYFGHSRALRCTGDDVLIVSGSQQALDLIARILIEPGDVVAVEDPGYPAAVAAFRPHGARIAPVPVDDQGIRTDALPRKAKLVYVTPSHQFPLGVALSLSRRRALLDWARRCNSMIIEDDYDSEFRYGGRPLDSLQGLDQSGRVMYLGTFSKVLFPSLRLGFVILPRSLRATFLAAKWITDRHTETIEQHVVADFINEGHFARYIRRMQRIYADRHDALNEALRRCLPMLSPLPSISGLHLSGLLPDEFRVSDLIARCAAGGVGLYAIEPFYAKRPRPGLLFGFGSCAAVDIKEGVRRIANVVRTFDGPRSDGSVSSF